MPRPAEILFLCALSLLGVGLVMVHSAGLTLAPEDAVTLKTIFISRHAAYLVLALSAMLAIYYLPVHRLAMPRSLSRWTPMLVPLIIALQLAVYMPVIGVELNGSRRWVNFFIPGLTMQPSEFAKWGMVIVLAWFCARRINSIKTIRRGLLPGLALLGLVGAVVAKEDFGTGVLIIGVGTIVLIAGGVRIWQLACVAPAGLAMIAAFVVTSPYRMERLVSFRDPFADPEGAGFHMIQSLATISGAGAFGRGLGFGLQKFDYLPEDTNDFLFPVIIEELGLAGAAAVMGLFAVLVWTGMGVVRREQNHLLKLAGIGVIATVGLQACMNLLVVTGLAPTKGIALPLVSSGGTGWIATAAAIGLLMAIDRCQHLPAIAASNADAETSQKQAKAPALEVHVRPIRLPGYSPTPPLVSAHHEPAPSQNDAESVGSAA